MRKETDFKDDEWTHRDFVFSFSTTDTGVVQSICAESVPNAPEAATCLADALRAIRFQSCNRYIVHFVLED